jgi:tRNA-guanine family transglycosylase
MNSSLKTSKGNIQYPCFLPVTTFGNRFPLDTMVRPYINRLSPVIMVSHFYAQEMIPLNLPIFIDSGGFASLFKGSEICHCSNGSHGIRTREDSNITPESVLAFQEEKADIAATLDFIIGPNVSSEEAKTLQQWTVENAIWAIETRNRDSMKLFASIQAWDRKSMIQILEKLLTFPFDGFALGGMVPRIRTPRVIFELVKAFRELEPHRPLHIFGIGSPRLVKALFDYGVSSVDSSNYVRNAASKRYLLPGKGEYVNIDETLEPAELCPCRACQQFSMGYLALEGELNNMALALHNLTATMSFLKIGGIDGS